MQFTPFSACEYNLSHNKIVSFVGSNAHLDKRYCIGLFYYRRDEKNTTRPSYRN